MCSHFLCSLRSMCKLQSLGEYYCVHNEFILLNSWGMCGFLLASKPWAAHYRFSTWVVIWTMFISTWAVWFQTWNVRQLLARASNIFGNAFKVCAMRSRFLSDWRDSKMHVITLRCTQRPGVSLVNLPGNNRACGFLLHCFQWFYIMYLFLLLILSPG